MTRLHVAALASVAVLVAAALPSESRQPRSKPVVDRDLHISFIVPPRTLPEMVAQADAVIVGRYVPGAQFTEWESRRDVPTLPMTIHPFEVVSIVKTHLRVPVPSETIEVRMYGGQREYDTHIERISVPGQRPLVLGRVHMLFVRWDEGHQVFGLPWSAASIHDVTSGTVRSQYEHDRVYTGRPIDDYLSDMGVLGRLPPFR